MVIAIQQTSHQGMIQTPLFDISGPKGSGNCTKQSCPTLISNSPKNQPLDPSMEGVNESLYFAGVFSGPQNGASFGILRVQEISFLSPYPIWRTPGQFLRGQEVILGRSRCFGDTTPQGFFSKSKRLTDAEMCKIPHITTLPMETPDPPNNNAGASKQVSLTPHDIPRILREVQNHLQTLN